MSVKYIVTHPGPAHKDEFLAIAVAFFIHGELPIHRREPTEAELKDPAVLVLDVGVKYEPELGNFDHHQRGREEEPECALSLYAKHVGLAETLGLRRWYAPTILLDVQGPFATAKTLGLPRFPFELSGPIEGQILATFEKIERTEPESLVSRILLLVGHEMVTSAQAYAEKLTALREMMTAITIDGAQCLVFETEDTEGSQEIRDKYYPEAVISLSWDDRGSGWSLYRYNDAPTVDFSVLEGLPGISFAHKGGFIAKTRDRVELDVVFEYVRRCIIDRCPVCGDARRDWGEGWECPGCGTI